MPLRPDLIPFSGNSMLFLSRTRVLTMLFLSRTRYFPMLCLFKPDIILFTPFSRSSFTHRVVTHSRKLFRRCSNRSDPYFAFLRPFSIPSYSCTIFVPYLSRFYTYFARFSLFCLSFLSTRGC